MDVDADDADDADDTDCADEVVVRPYCRGGPAEGPDRGSNAAGGADSPAVAGSRGDAAALWSLKRGFELGLGSGTGDDGKADRYEAKLTADYRERYLAWVDRCVDEEPGCVLVADAGSGDPDAGSDPVGNTPDGGSDAVEADRGDATGELLGYAFVLPASLAFVWDAAVLNELYVVPAARGTGVADRLMGAALDHARGQDLPLDRLVLDVDRANDRARAFYDRYGFEHWGEMVAREL